LQRYSESSEEEAQQIISLKSEFPYCQVLHTLAARVTKDHRFGNHQEALQLAAIYAADRNILKEIITHQHIVEEVAAEVLPVITKEELVQRPEEIIQRSADQIISSVDIADEVMHDLETLNTLKHNFEMLMVEYTEVKTKSEEKETSDNGESHSIDEGVVKEKSKSRKERIIELAKSMKLTESGDEKGTTADEKKKAGSKKGNQPDALIEEIRVTKEEIKPENEKQKEQIEIINQFIKIQPSISNSKDRTIPVVADLNPIKSGEFGDNVVSETLVEILIKQGKKDRAIEVLKKLIWKYPQKKSYFASQIEDLKK
jgi:hypothetical protein